MKVRSWKYLLMLITVVWAVAWFNLLFTAAALAAPARNAEEELAQPTGQKFKARTQGDEWFNWTASDTGEVLVKSKSGYWEYAEMTTSGPKSTGKKIKIDPKPAQALKADALVKWKKDGKNKDSRQQELPATIPLNTPTIEENLTTGDAPLNSPLAESGLLPATPFSQKVLVLLVQFTNATIQNSEATWSDTFFGASGTTVNNYYTEVSNGRFSFSPAEETSGVVNDGVIKVTLNYAHPNTAGNTGAANQDIVKNALTAANPYINYAAFDTDNNGGLSNSELHVVTIIAGYERSYSSSYSPSVWGHRWSLWNQLNLDGKVLCYSGYGGGYTQQGEMHATHMATIGILSHELGHDLGLPDLYDYDGSSSGVGNHSLMAGGSWGAVSGYSGSSPTHMDAWSKVDLGFVTPTVANASGNYTVNSPGSGSYSVVKVLTSDPNQYFLIENRQFTGYDAALSPQIGSGGIAIWHIDNGVIVSKNRYGINDDENHKGVDLEEANEGALGYSQLDKRLGGIYNHYYYSGSYTQFGNATVPGSKLFNGTSSGVAVSVSSASALSMIVNVTIPGPPSNNANLSGLLLSSGTLNPVFASGTTNYSASVAGTVTSIMVRPTAADPNATIKVNNSPVASGQNSGNIFLNYGPNTVNVVVTAQDGTQKTYTVTVTRVVSSNANLSGLSVSHGALSPAFSTTTTNYTASVDGTIGVITVWPTAADSFASIKVNGLADLSGQNAWPVLLNYGANTINIVVTAQDGTQKTYAVTVTRVPSSNANLIGLTLSNGTLMPAFSSTTTGYTVSLASGISSITLRPTAASYATIKVNGTSVASGQSTAPIAMVMGDNVITIVVTAQDGVTQKTYTVTANRAPSTNANLKSLVLSNGSLSPVFAAATLNYNATVASSVASIKVTPASEDPNAAIRVNGSVVPSGTPSNAINLLEGANTITVTVTAENGTTTKSYVLTVDRLSPSMEAFQAVSTTPEGNALEVPVDTPVSVTFNRDVLPGVNFGRITLTKGRTAVICNKEFTGSTMRFVTGELAPNTVYTITIPAYGVKDANGVGLEKNFTYKFTTTDTIKPQVKSSVPRNSGINVSTKQVVIIKFSEPVQAGANIAAISLKDGANNLDFTYTLTGTDLKLSPTIEFRYGAQITLTLPAGAVKDLAGNETDTPLVMNFTVIGDKLKPVLAESFPLNRATAFPVNQSITVTFNENIAAGPQFGNITLKKGTTVIAAAVSISGKTVTINPVSDLEPYQRYIASIPYMALMDTTGNPAGAVTLNFTTDTQPVVRMTTPSSKAINVPLGQVIIVEFSKDIVGGSKLSDITLRKGTASLSFDTSITDARITITPTQPLEFNSNYTLYIPAGAVQDLNGVPGGAYTLTFASQETVAPLMATTYPVDLAVNIPVNKNITISFKENVQEGANFEGITISDGVDSIACAKFFKGRVLVIDPLANLEYTKTYTVTVPAGAIKDMAGNPSLEEKVFTFTTALDKMKPKLILTDPVKNAINVTVDQTISLQFDEMLQEGSNFNKILLKAGRVLLPVTPSVSGDELIITPLEQLSFNTKYTVFVPSGALTDTSGNLAPATSFTFTTVQDFSVPVITESDPVNGATEVAVDKTITVTLSKEVLAGVNFRYITLTEAGSPTSLLVTKKIVGKVLTLDPRYNLAAGKVYEVYLPAGAFKDTLGNVSRYYKFTFST